MPTMLYTNGFLLVVLKNNKNSEPIHKKSLQVIKKYKYENFKTSNG